MIGRTIAHYRIVEPLGSGGMGTVYRAQHTALASRVVALKVLSDAVANQPQLRERFLREAEIMAALHHENIVMLHDFLAVDGVYAIVMELIPGVTLDRWAGKSPVPFERAAPLLRQLLAALQHAHQHGVVHRDVKPSNVLVTPEGRVKVTDFGIARIAQSSELTQTGMGMGTPRYMSPEQIQGRRHLVGPASDIYSCGVLVHRVLAGRVPFEADDEEASFSILQAHVTKPPPPLRSLVREVPVDAERAVLRALAKRPEDRWPTCTAFAHAMGLASAEEAAAAAAAMPAPARDRDADATVIPGAASRPERKPDTRRLAHAPPPETRIDVVPGPPRWVRGAWVLAAVLALALVSAGITVWWAGRAGSPEAADRPAATTDAPRPAATAAAGTQGPAKAPMTPGPAPDSPPPAVAPAGAATPSTAGTIASTAAPDPGPTAPAVAPALAPAPAGVTPPPAAAVPPAASVAVVPSPAADAVPQPAAAPPAPSPHAAALLRAEAQLDAGSPAAALATLEPVLADDPKEPRAVALRRRATEARAAQQRRESEERHRQASAKAGEARALLAKGKIELALAAANDALRIEPGHAEARRVRAAAEEERRAAREAWAGGASGSPQVQSEDSR